MIAGLLAELDGSGLLHESQGAKVVDVPGLEEPCILVKADGATIYQTRDVAAALHRHDTWKGFAKCLYVVAANQEFHFMQVFGVFDQMRPESAGRLVHVKFGMVRDAEGAIYSTREGASARLDDILDDARDRALELVRLKSGGLDDELAVAEAVGHSALAFEFLKRSPTRDVKFVFEEASRSDGDTGPYLQYTHARCCSIISECGGALPESWDPTLLCGPEEVEVLKALWRLPVAIARSADPDRDVYDTSVLASGLMEVARCFGSFYTAPAVGGEGRKYRYPVRDAEMATRDARLMLVDGVRRALEMGLGLLTIRAPQRM
jgi:arginyl-tRNA synthetase